MTAVVTILIASFAAPRSAPHIKAAVIERDAAMSAAKAGHFDQAMERFRKAIAIEPTYIEAYEGLIGVLEEARKPIDMAHAITQLLQIDPDKTLYRLKLAGFLASSGDAQRALAQYALALKAAPTNADALAGVMATARKTGLADKAFEAQARGHALYPADKRFE